MIDEQAKFATRFCEDPTGKFGCETDASKNDPLPDLLGELVLRVPLIICLREPQRLCKLSESCLVIKPITRLREQRLLFPINGHVGRWKQVKPVTVVCQGCRQDGKDAVRQTV